MVANTILEQLGGRRFSAMTGAKDFIGSDTGLSFKIGRNASQANGVRIEYDAGRDLYNIQFLRAAKTKQGFQLKEIKKVDGIYFDQLTEIFTSITGLYTHL